MNFKKIWNKVIHSRLTHKLFFIVVGVINGTAITVFFFINWLDKVGFMKVEVGFSTWSFGYYYCFFGTLQTF